MRTKVNWPTGLLKVADGVDENGFVRIVGAMMGATIATVALPENAPLFAAAPDLLNALIDLLDSMDANGSCQYEMLRASARAAIAKATGEGA